MTWANQIRMLKQNFQKLGSVIGSGFIAWLRPMVVAVNNAMDSIISAVQKVVNALGKIFGWEMIVDTTGDSLVDDTEEVAEAWDDATDAAKKYAKQLLGIDEINNLTTNDSGSGSGDEGAGGGISGGNIVKPGGIEFKKFESEIDNLYDLGKKLSEAFANLLPDDWTEIYKKAANFGSGLADFLNGLIQPDTFNKIGKTIAGALMTAIIALASFSEDADWEQYGTSLGENINGFFEEFDAEKFMDGINTFANGIWEAIKTALKTVDWGSVWTDITTLINNASPSTIALVLGTVIISKISKWVLGGGVISSLGSTIGAGITKSHGLWKFLTTDTAALSAAGVSAGSIIATGIIGGLAAAWLGWTGGQLLYKLLTGDDTDYGNFGEQMGQIVQSIKDGDAGAALQEWWGEICDNLIAFSNDALGAISSAFSSFGELVGEIFSPLGQFIMDTFAPVGDFISGIFNGVKNFLSGIVETIAGLFTGAWDLIKGAWNGAVDFFSGIWDGIKKAFSVVKDFFGGMFEGAWFTIKTVWGVVVDFFKGIWSGIKGAFSTVKDFFVNIFQGAWNGIKGIWEKVTGFFQGLWNNIKSIFSYVGDFFKGIFQGAADAVHGVMTGLFEVIKAPINFIIDGVNLLIGGLNHIKIPDWVPAIGGVGINIPLLEKFEYGGFPDQGSLFVAGETYGQSEWLGNINGKTGVASGYEITGIANAIYDTSAREMELLRQQNEYLMGILNKEFGISRDAVGEASRSYARDYYKRTGNQAYSF